MQMNPSQVKGLTLILIVAVIWLAASFIVQSIEHDLHPFLLSFFCNLLFLIYVPLSYLQEKTGRCSPKAEEHGSFTVVSPRQGAATHAVTRSPAAADAALNAALDIERHADSDRVALVSSSDRAGRTSSPQTALSAAPAADRWAIARAAAAVAPLWFLAQLCFNVALSLTSVTSNTILSSPSSLFTLFLSVVLLGEPFAVSKLVAVLLTVAGTVLVALADSLATSDNLGERNGVLGDILTLAAAALYACYTVTLKQMMPSQKESEMMAFFGYMGAINGVLFGPFVVGLQLAGKFDVFAISSHVLGLVLLKGLFDNALADYLWSKAVLLVGPTIATVGLSLQVPLAMLVEPLVSRSGWWSRWDVCTLEMLGGSFILGGFFWLNASEFAAAAPS